MIPISAIIPYFGFFSNLMIVAAVLEVSAYIYLYVLEKSLAAEQQASRVLRKLTSNQTEESLSSLPTDNPPAAASTETSPHSDNSISQIENTEQ